MKIDVNKNIDKLIKRSLQQHREMREMLKSLAQHIEIHPLPQIEKFNARFHELQQSSLHTDRQLQEQVKVTDIPEYLMEQFEHRASLQQEILFLLKDTLPKAKSIKSLMASEMQTLRKGRTALSGYRSQEEKHGRIVNKSL